MTDLDSSNDREQWNNEYNCVYEMLNTQLNELMKYPLFSAKYNELKNFLDQINNNFGIYTVNTRKNMMEYFKNNNIKRLLFINNLAMINQDLIESPQAGVKRLKKAKHDEKRRQKNIIDSIVFRLTDLRHKSEKYNMLITDETNAIFRELHDNLLILYYQDILNSEIYDRYNEIATQYKKKISEQEIILNKKLSNNE